MTRQELAAFKRLEKRRDSMFSALCIIKTWLSFPDEGAYTIPYRQARDGAHRGGARGYGKGRRREVIGLIVYVVGFLLALFAGSFTIARCCPWDSPTEPDTFLLLMAAALAWPLTFPLVLAIILLLGIARLAEKLAGGAE
jgi:hypothetical protein